MAFTNTGPGRTRNDIGKTSDATYNVVGYVMPSGQGGRDTAGDRGDFSTSNVGRVVRNPGGGQGTPGGTQDMSGPSGGYRTFNNFVGGVVRRGG